MGVGILSHATMDVRASYYTKSRVLHTDFMILLNPNISAYYTDICSSYFDNAFYAICQNIPRYIKLWYKLYALYVRCLEQHVVVLYIDNVPETKCTLIALKYSDLDVIFFQYVKISLAGS